MRRTAKKSILMFSSVFCLFLYLPDVNSDHSVHCEIGSETELQYFSKNEWITLLGVPMICNRISTLPIQEDHISAYSDVKVYNLSIYESHIPNVIKNAFSNFPNLLVLSLNHIGLKSLNYKCFEENGELQELYMSQNLLTEIRKGILSPLENLIILDLSFNRITYIEQGAFNELTSLINLNLSQNRIKNIGNSTFHSMQLLEYLDLSGNELKTFTSLFNNLNNLIHLNLSDNRIISLTKGGFKDLKNLRVLDLSFNFLDVLIVGSLTGLDNLTYFNLSHNKLHVLDCLSLFALQNLEEMLLHNNRLTFIDIEELLGCLPKLTDITLEENNWDCAILLRALQNLRKFHVQIREGYSYLIQNIHGIRCSKTTEFAYENENLTPKSLNNVVDNSQNIKTDLKTYFSDGVHQKIPDTFVDEISNSQVMKPTITHEELLLKVINSSKVTNLLLQALLNKDIRSNNPLLTNDEDERGFHEYVETDVPFIVDESIAVDVTNSGKENDTDTNSAEQITTSSQSTEKSNNENLAIKTNLLAENLFNRRIRKFNSSIQKSPPNLVNYSSGKIIAHGDKIQVQNSENKTSVNEIFTQNNVKIPVIKNNNMFYLYLGISITVIVIAVVFAVIYSYVWNNYAGLI